MGALAPAHRNRLVKYLGMCGSDFDGERAAAALKANELVRGLGLQWSDVIATPAPNYRRVPTTRPSYQSAERKRINRALQNYDALTQWEQNFVSSLQQTTSLSPKQRSILADIMASLTAKGRS